MATRVSPRPLEEGPGMRAMRLPSSAASPAWWIVCGKGSGFRVQGSESDNQKSEIRNQKSVVALRSDLPSPAGTDLKGWSGRGARG